jgi:hypothetical protein
MRLLESRRMRWEGYMAFMGERTNGYRVLVGSPQGKGELGRAKHQCDNNIEMDLEEI